MREDEIFLYRVRVCANEPPPDDCGFIDTLLNVRISANDCLNLLPRSTVQQVGSAKEAPGLKLDSNLDSWSENEPSPPPLPRD